ncbi:hypothetical protein Tco_0654270 [Tanacetum coccineum]|uniref:Uncharacterized protein n=1 Tax=Tanacetum coccineum TaxID=301880 RepID=A0ABQ4X2R0_9ASTR
MKDQPLSADASPTALSPSYIANFNPEEDEEDPNEDPTDYSTNERDNSDDESSDDDDVEKDEEDEEEEEHLASADPSAVPIDDHIPFPLSQPSPVLTAPPPSLIRSLGYRVATIWMRVKAAATSHSLPLPPTLILSPTRPDAPPPLPTSAPTSFPPLLLPSNSHREGRPKVNLPPRMRLGIALGPRYEVGESSAAAAARPAGGLRADYSFVPHGQAD